MRRDCDAVRDHLPSLAAAPDSGDPGERELAPLREHLATCPDCRQELAGWRAFIGRGRDALGIPEDPEELARQAARIAATQAAFMELVRDSYAAPERAAASSITGEPEAAAAREGIFLGELIRRALEATGAWRLILPLLHIPRQLPLAAADQTEPSGLHPEQLLQVSDPDERVLVELLLTEGERRLFVSSAEPLLRQARVEVRIRTEAGQEAVQALQLDEGAGDWRLPGELLLEGACGVEVAVLDLSADSPRAGEEPG